MNFSFAFLNAATFRKILTNSYPKSFFYANSKMHAEKSAMTLHAQKHRIRLEFRKNVYANQMIRASISWTKEDTKN